MHTERMAMTEKGRGGDPRLLESPAPWMPWVMSVFFHAGLVLILMFVCVLAVPAEKQDPIVRIPIAPPWAEPSLRLDVGRPASVAMAGAIGPSLQPLPAPRAGSVRDIVSTPAASDVRIPIRVDTPSAGQGTPSGMRAGIYGVTIGGGRDSEEQAAEVVFVIDGSGSMMSVFDELRSRVLLAIGRLGLTQRYDLLIFTDTGFLEHPRATLCWPQEADRPAALAAARMLMAYRPAGQTRPEQALRRALALLGRGRTKARRVILLFSDGAFADPAGVGDLIGRESRTKEVTVHTFYFGPAAGPGAATMRRIAADSGGVCTLLRRQE